MTPALEPAFVQLLEHLHRVVTGSAYGYYHRIGHGSTWWNGHGPPAPPTLNDVYFGVHPSTDDRGTDRRATLDTIAAINALYADFDAKDFGNDKTATFVAVQQIDPPPSVIVDSGGGFHCYWLLASPWQLDALAEREQARGIQARWVPRVGGDDGAKDLARMLRVPGTFNTKYDPPRLVDFVSADFAMVYDLAELTTYLPPEPAPAAAFLVPLIALPTDRAQRWAEEKMRRICTELGQTTDHKHQRRLEQSRLAGGVVALGLISADAAEQRLFNALPPSAQQAKERKAIRDGIAFGTQSPLTLPIFPTEQALIFKDDIAHCPSCDTPVSRSKYDYPDTSERGWYCRVCKHPMVWPADAYTPPAKLKSAPGLTLPLRRARSALIIEALGRLGYTFRRNFCADVTEVNGRPIDDVIAAQIRTQMRDLDITPIGAVEDAYLTEAARNTYHPVKDYLNGLQCDGGDHIGALTSKLHGDDPPVVYTDGRQQALLSAYLLRWLIGAVAKVLGEAQNVMLVLAGPQGIGKSEFVAWLCSGLPEYFLEAPINVTDKDSDVRLMNRFIWEVSELDATTRKADVSALKAFITKREVSVRKAYGRHDTVKPALASLIGTVNEGTGFLSDETGNRRFMIAALKHIDWSYKQLDVNQVWAQAVALYRSGEPWRLQPEELGQQIERNKGYETESLLDGWIVKYFDLDAGHYARMTASEIADHLRGSDIRLSGNPRTDAMEISRVLIRLGVRKHRTERSRGYVGIAPRGSSVRGDDGRNDNLGGDSDNLSQGVVTERIAPQRPNGNLTTFDNLHPIESQNEQEHHAEHGEKVIYRSQSSHVVTSSQVVSDTAETPTAQEQRQQAASQVYDDGKASRVHLAIQAQQWRKAQHEIGQVRSATRRKALEAELIAAEHAARPPDLG